MANVINIKICFNFNVLNSYYNLIFVEKPVNLNKHNLYFMLKEIFIWWNGQTLGTRLWTYFNGILVGEDGQGNKYFQNKSVKMVGGIRKNRKDSSIKILSSKIANYIRMKILNDNCQDTGCSLKIFDKKIFLKFPYFNGIHRFIPALFSGQGYETAFINVSHRARTTGISKYGTIDRLFKGILDVYKVKKIINQKGFDD